MSHPSARNGELKIVYGKRHGDLVICYGEGTRRADAHLLLSAVTSRVLEADFPVAFELERQGAMADSILQQLTARGYDPSTLRISIEKTGENQT